jgi:hypothetical protein
MSEEGYARPKHVAEESISTEDQQYCNRMLKSTNIYIF